MPGTAGPLPKRSWDVGWQLNLRACKQALSYSSKNVQWLEMLCFQIKVGKDSHILCDAGARLQL